MLAFHAFRSVDERLDYIFFSSIGYTNGSENGFAFTLPLFYAIVIIGTSLYSLRNRISCSSMDTYSEGSGSLAGGDRRLWLFP